MRNCVYLAMGGASIRPIISWACKSCSYKVLYSSNPPLRISHSFFSTWTNNSVIPKPSSSSPIPMRLQNDKLIFWPDHRRRFMSSSSTRAELDFSAYFNEEDIEKILSTVNDIPNVDDLQKFGISKKAIKVLGEKKSNGGRQQMVENIDDLITILGATPSLRAFGNILERRNPSLKNPMFPYPTKVMVEKADTILSIVLHGSQISWCCIERNVQDKTFLLKQLQFKPLSLKSRQHFLSSLSEMVELSHRIPDANLCIIEEYPQVAANPQTFSYLLHMTQLRAFLLGRLAVRLDLENIIAIKTVAVARLFNTAVGREKVSGQHLVDNMITWKPLPSLIVPQRLKDEYENYTVVIKEGLANSILLNLAYWKLTKQFTDSYL